MPALLTLVCTGVRMLLAIREAQGAAEAMRLSRTDEVTRLPNRRALLAAADAATDRCQPVGLMLLDLDGFKDVNDSLGRAVGDEVLIALGLRMRRALDRHVVVARLGGDEFALLVPGDTAVDLLEIAHQVRGVLRAPLRVESFDLPIDASGGVTIREADDTSSTELLRRVDIAMYEAKLSRAGALLFDSSQDGFSRQRLRRGDDLRQAIADDQLVAWYQPQVEGLLSPIAFLPDARRAGLMPALTARVVDLVPGDARTRLDAGLSFRVAVNCAPPELLDGQLLPLLFAALDRAGLPGDSLLIEVTEDSFLSDPERARGAAGAAGP